MKEMYPVFISDSVPMMESIHRCLLRMEREPLNREIVHEAFRAVHSLKSEAAYVGHAQSASMLHSMETILEEVRQGRKSPDKKIVDEMITLLDEIGNVIGKTPTQNRDHAGKGAVPEQSVFSGDIYFSEFELQLLEEARERGERLYRLVCDIDRNASMKYARLYLLVSNLEQIVNLIKVEPDLDYLRDQERDFNALTFYFTCGDDLSPVYRAININEVFRNHLSSPDYERYLSAAGLRRVSTTAGQAEEKHPAAKPETEADLSSDTVRIDKKLFDALVGSVSQIRNRLRGMEKYGHGEPDAKPGSGAVLEEVRNLSGFSDSLQELLQKVRMVGFKEKEWQLTRFIRDFSKQLGKNIKFSTVGFDLEIDRTIAEPVNECIIHLLRNAADHGIEGEEEREKLHKPAEGEITVTVSKNNDRVVVQVMDDGRGISEDGVRARAAELGYAQETLRRMDLLTLLTRPGLSTRLEATDASGRGVGLDLVTQKLKNCPGSALRLFSKVGEGTVFTIDIPQPYAAAELLICRRADIILAIPKQAYVSTEIPEKTRLGLDEKGLLWYRDLPVYTEMGRLGTAVIPSGDCYMVLLRYSQKQAYLYIDEFLFEKNLTEKELRLFASGDAEVPSLAAEFPGTRIRYVDPGMFV